MTKDELKNKILELSPAAVFDETGEWLCVLIDSPGWLLFAKQLREDADLHFDYLFCATAVDWKTHLTVVYHLTSTSHRHTVVVKAKIADRNNSEIETVSHIWRTAEFHELECYDLMGVKFLHHPGLRRLFLTEDWAGWPLRKDYVDPVNMIEL